MAKQKGEEYKCDECGLVVLVQNPCECDESCELVCCQAPMKKTGSKTAASKPQEKK